MQRALRIAHLYPDHMNNYGDRGNIIALTQRCRWRGIAVEVVGVQPGAAVAWASFDLVFFGGGQDSGQALIAADFVRRQFATFRSRPAAVPAGRSAARQALVSLCQVLLGSNEFLYLE